jgi:hypothetical protein
MDRETISAKPQLAERLDTCTLSGIVFAGSFTLSAVAAGPDGLRGVRGANNPRTSNDTCTELWRVSAFGGHRCRLR